MDLQAQYVWENIFYQKEFSCGGYQFVLHEYQGKCTNKSCCIFEKGLTPTDFLVSRR
jgi:hypothetical protein